MYFTVETSVFLSDYRMSKQYKKFGQRFSGDQRLSRVRQRPVLRTYLCLFQNLKFGQRFRGDQGNFRPRQVSGLYLPKFQSKIRMQNSKFGQRFCGTLKIRDRNKHCLKLSDLRMSNFLTRAGHESTSY